MALARVAIRTLARVLFVWVGGATLRFDWIQTTVALSYWL
jgi:hypothetical protein